MIGTYTVTGPDFKTLNITETVWISEISRKIFKIRQLVT